MEDNSGPVSWQWQCGHVSAGTTGQWCPCGAHQRSITLNYHNHNERITGLQHCYSLVTTLLQPRDNMPVFRSSHAERDTVTRDTLTSVHLDSRWRRGWLHQEEESTTSGDVLASWIVLVRTFKMDFNTDREWWCDVMRCGVEAVENIFIGSINLKFCFHPKFSQVPLCSTHCFIFHGSTICVYKRLVNMVGKQELAIW